MKPILCVDFDGVVHSYTSKWTTADEIKDPPVAGAMEWLLEATKFFRVVIYSSRSKDSGGIQAMTDWMRHYGGSEVVKVVEFAHEKPAAFLTVDDRAICFYGRFDVLSPEELLNFKPWNK
jgi:hypothetical protein